MLVAVSLVLTSGEDQERSGNLGVLVYTQRVNVSGESVKECGNEWGSVSQLVSCPGCDELPGNAGANPEQVEWGDLMVEWPSKLAGLKGGCAIPLTLISHPIIIIYRGGRTFWIVGYNVTSIYDMCTLADSGNEAINISQIADCELNIALQM